MKKFMQKGTIMCLMLFMMVFLVQQPVVAAEMSDTTVPESEAEVQTPVYSVTVKFNKNGGSGSMPNQVVSSDLTSAKLNANNFKRTGFTFNGWNTKANGTGKNYADKAEMIQLATAGNNGAVTELYAQWKLKTPGISKLKSATPVTVKVSYKKDSKAAGYEIQCCTSNKFKKSVKKFTAKKGTSSQIIEVTPGKKNYVRIRTYFKNGSKKVYSDWSKTKSIKVKSVKTISNTSSKATIEADVKLTGSGSGYHAKLVICTATSAVSYGIQYDQHARAPYTGKAMAMIENVSSNAAGGQSYYWPGNHELKRGQTYHMMMTIDNKGKGAVYLDYKKIGSFSNPSLANQQLYLRVEGAARLNGDKVDATFSNVKCKNGGKYWPEKVWGKHEFKTNKTLKCSVKKDGTIRFTGRISGIVGDWDSAYDKVSDIIQFVE